MNQLLPILLLAGVLFGLIKKVKVYDEFASGVSDGLRTMLSAAPNICAAVICIGFFRRSGLMDHMVALLHGAFASVGVPGELAPLILMRPLSGGGSLSILQSIFEQYGPDSYISRTAASMLGSTETIFYTVAVYLSGIKTKGSGWAVAVALIVCFAGAVFAAAAARVV